MAWRLAVVSAAGRSAGHGVLLAAGDRAGVVPSQPPAAQPARCRDDRAGRDGQHPPRQPPAVPADGTAAGYHPGLEAGRRFTDRQQRQQVLCGDGELPDAVLAGATPLQVRDGLCPFSASQRPQRQFRGHIGPVFAVHRVQLTYCLPPPGDRPHAACPGCPLIWVPAVAGRRSRWARPGGPGPETGHGRNRMAA